MKKLAIAMLFLAATFACLNVYAKDDNSMSPPKPVDNKTLDSMVGTWTGESEMMGTKMQDTVKISWTLNHQFLLFELSSKAVNNPQNHYEGLGLFGVTESDQVKLWWFDTWGAKTVSTGSGVTKNNQLRMTDSNAMFKEVRTFTMNGDEMTMTAKGTMDMNGKKVPFDQKVVYKR